MCLKWVSVVLNPVSTMSHGGILLDEDVHLDTRTTDASVIATTIKTTVPASKRRRVIYYYEWCCSFIIIVLLWPCIIVQFVMSCVVFYRCDSQLPACLLTPDRWGERTPSVVIKRKQWRARTKVKVTFTLSRHNEPLRDAIGWRCATTYKDDQPRLHHLSLTQVSPQL